MGMVSGVLADGSLQDLEIQALSTWLAERENLVSEWPCSAIASWVRSVCADGVIQENERQFLLENLKRLVATDFSQTGAMQADSTVLPIDDSKPVQFVGSVVVHTGRFLYGTRQRCESLSSSLGALPADSVSRKVRLVVIGAQASSGWITESYGRKIMAAVQLRDEGHEIQIVSERHWLETAQQLLGMRG